MLRIPCIFALVTTAAAQPALWQLPVEHASFAPNVAANFTSSVVGLLTGAGYPDTVMLRGGVPVLFNSPAARNGLETIANAPTGCTAMAIRRMATSMGHRLDALVVANATGLSHWTKSAGGALAWSPVANSSAWATTMFMHAADLNGDGYEDLIGVTNAGGKLRVRLATSTGGYGVEYTRSISDVVTSLTDTPTTNPASTAPRALVIAGSGWVTEYDYTLTKELKRAPIGSAAILTTLRRPVERLTCAARTGNQWSIAVIDSLNPMWFSLGALDLVAGAAGDVDMDGDDDIVFSQRNNHRSLLLIFRPDRPTWFSTNPLDAIEVPLIGDVTNPAASAGAAPANNAVPVFTDLDGDGDADFLQPVSTVGDVAVVRNLISGQLPLLASKDIQGGGSATEIRFDLTNSACPAGATHVEVVTWRMEISAGSFVPASSPQTQITRIPLSAPPATTTTVAVPVNEFYMVEYVTAPSHGIYFAQVRLVSMTGGNVTKVHPALNMLLADVKNGTLESSEQVWRPGINSGNNNTVGGIGGSNVVIVNPPPPTPPASGGGSGPL